jgi:hypothetical protein
MLIRFLQNYGKRPLAGRVEEDAARGLCGGAALGEGI